MRTTGQSATEIGLVIGLVAIGGIAALNVFSGAVQTQTDKLTAGVSGTIGGMLTMPGGGAGGGTAGAVATATDGTTAGAASTGGGATTSTFASSYPATAAGFDQMLSELPDIIETSGANGTTKELMSYLGNVAETLVADGEITPEQGNLLQEMANAGHKVAEWQGAVETVISSLPPDTTMAQFNDKQVTVNGETKSMLEALEEVNTRGYSLGQDPTEHFSVASYFMDDDVASRSTSKFAKAYKEAQATGALDNPSVNTVVNSLVENYLSTSEVFNHELMFYPEDHPIDTMPLAVQKEAAYQNMIISANTHGNSAGICTTGGGADSGTFCQ